MKRKIALVSGGSSGVGLSIVKELISNNYYVYFIGSNEQKGRAIHEDFTNEYGQSSEFMQLDLSNLKNVIEFTAEFKNKVEKLDLLINTAGIMMPDRKESVDGIELAMAIGYYSAFLLIQELSTLLEKVSHSRVVNVSGIASQMLKERLDFADFNHTNNYNGMKAAFDAVHAKTVLTEIFSERFRDKKIDVNAFHPGAIKSNVFRNMSPIKRGLFKIVSILFSKKSKNGIYVALSDKLTGVTGKLFVKNKPLSINFKAKYKEQLLAQTTEALKKIGLPSNGLIES